MRINITMIIGAVISALGWLFLIFGTGVPSGRYEAPVYNLQLGALAQQTISLGYVTMIIAALSTLVSALRPAGVEIGNRATEKGSAPTVETLEADEGEVDAMRRLVLKGMR